MDSKRGVVHDFGWHGAEIEMTPANIQISLAMWGMIACVVLELWR